MLSLARAEGLPISYLNIKLTAALPLLDKFPLKVSLLSGRRIANDVSLVAIIFLCANILQVPLPSVPGSRWSCQSLGMLRYHCTMSICDVGICSADEKFDDILAL